MTEVLLYGLDETGQIVFTQTLQVADRVALRALAEARLREDHAVEIWEGPLCVVRLRRKAAAPETA